VRSDTLSKESSRRHVPQLAAGALNGRGGASASRPTTAEDSTPLMTSKRDAGFDDVIVRWCRVAAPL
jgi:hypothetical protein